MMNSPGIVVDVCRRLDKINVGIANFIEKMTISWTLRVDGITKKTYNGYLINDFGSTIAHKAARMELGEKLTIRTGVILERVQ